MGDYIAFTAFMALATLAELGVYCYMRDGDRAEFMIEERPDRDAFREHLKKAPIKEKLHYALRATHYVKNKPIINKTNQ